jgi:hypothetical protein
MPCSTPDVIVAGFLPLQMVYELTIYIRFKRLATNVNDILDP